MQFTLSVYDENLKCKVCGAHASEFHNDGCEVGALLQELSRLTKGAVDLPRACARGNHYANERGRSFDFCPDCGKPLT